MARKTNTPQAVRVRALVSFMDVREGDESVCPLDAIVQGWVNAGFVRVVEVITSGSTEAGPSGAEPDDSGSGED